VFAQRAAIVAGAAQKQLDADKDEIEETEGGVRGVERSSRRPDLIPPLITS
jgi:hypothetical protein